MPQTHHDCLPNRAGSIKLSPHSPAVFTTPEGRVTIEFPGGSVFSETEVTLKPVIKDLIQPLPAGMAPASTLFRVYGLSGLLPKDATMKVKYSTVDLNAAVSDASKLVLAWYDESDTRWSALKTDVDAGAMTLSATTNRFSIWAVMVSGGGAGIAQTTPFSQQSGAGAVRTTYAGVDVVIVVAALGLCVVVIGKRWLH